MTKEKVLIPNELAQQMFDKQQELQDAQVKENETNAAHKAAKKNRENAESELSALVKQAKDGPGELFKTADEGDELPADGK